jgi:hypothetical protein
MPYYTEDTAQRSVIPLSEIPSTFSEVMEAQFASTVTELPTVATRRAAELFQAHREGVRIDRAAALARVKDAGLEGQLSIESGGITQAALDILIERKRDELRRASILARAEGGFLENVSRFGVAIGTSLADPVNVGLSFVPVVGQARYVRMLKAAATPLGRAGVRAGVGAAEGAVGAAIVEPLIYSAKQYEQADYDMLDSLLNVGFGTIYGGGLHVVGGAAADAIARVRGEPSLVRRAIDTALEERARPLTRETIDAGGERLSTQLDTAAEISAAEVRGDAARIAASVAADTREQALRVAEGQLMSGDRVNVEPLFAGERGRLADGTDTADLVPGRFQIAEQRARAADLEESAARRLSAIEEQAARAGGEAKPRYTPRLLRELEAARGQRAAAQALREGRDLTPAETEQLRQAVVADAIERGAPVPEQALEGAPESIRARAAEVRKAAVAEATRRDAGAADPEAVAQERAAADVDREISQADETLEAAEEESKLAEQLLNEQAARFGDEAADETITAAKELANRLTTWSRAAELAQVCVLRGG